jgi:hypothetical protein
MIATNKLSPIGKVSTEADLPDGLQKFYFSVNSNPSFSTMQMCSSSYFLELRTAFALGFQRHVVMSANDEFVDVNHQQDWKFIDTKHSNHGKYFL